MAFRKFVLTPAAMAVAALAFVTGALAQTLPASSVEDSPLWFVEFTGKPVADGASLAAVQAEQAAFRAAAANAGLAFSERRSYNSLFNGLAISVSPSNRAQLARLAGVKAMHRIETVQAPVPELASGSAMDLANALALTRTDIAQNSLGLTGAGVKVAIIDSGIDIDHPAFGGSGVNGTTPFPTARIVAGWDFVGDAFNSSGTGAALIPAPDANPDDCGGHGTHVAGIVGANGAGLKGVAPGVSFGAYRVFGCGGTTTSDIILAAMERALVDGMQVINMSIGARSQWPQYPTGQAASRLANKGVVVVASIGNNGPVAGSTAADGLFAAGAPGTGESVIGVASFDNSHVTQLTFTASPGGEQLTYDRIGGSPPSPLTGGESMARTGTTASTADACPPWDTTFGGTSWGTGTGYLATNSMTGKAVLSRRGTCTFYAKALNAQLAGAHAVVIYNNSPVNINPTVAAPVGKPAITIPVIWLTSANGALLDGKIAFGATTIAWSDQVIATPLASGGLISNFSSFGLAADLSLKPDLGAPGGSIYSAYPLELGKFLSTSGTSMSSPHVAGAAALILERLPHAALGRQSAIVGRNAPPLINMLTRMINTAKPKAWSGNPTLGFIDHSFRQGGGMLDVVAAVQSEQFVVPAKIATGESDAGPTLQKLTIRNDASATVTYTLGHVAGLAAGPNTQSGAAYNIGGAISAPASVTFSSPTVVVPAKGTASVNVTITAHPGLINRGLYGGYITLTPQGDGMALSVPYAGLKGDYQSTQVLTPTANGFPWLTKASGTSHTKQAAGAVYTMVGGDVPNVLYHLDHLSRTFRLEALDATTLASRGVILEDHYVGRNLTPTGAFASAWNGDINFVTQPNGNYIIRISVLKALGNPANPAHWEIWDSPSLTIQRP